MSNAWWTRVGLGLVVALGGAGGAGPGCLRGGGQDGSGHATRWHRGRAAGAAIDGPGGSFGNSGILMSITVTPGTATIESLNGAPVMQAFTATGKLKDGTSAAITSMDHLGRERQRRLAASTRPAPTRRAVRIGGVVTGARPRCRGRDHARRSRSCSTSRRTTLRWRRPACRPRSRARPTPTPSWSGPIPTTARCGRAACSRPSSSGTAGPRPTSLPRGGAEPDVPVRGLRHGHQRALVPGPLRPDHLAEARRLDRGPDARSPSPAGTGRPRPRSPPRPGRSRPGVDARHHLLLVQRSRPRAPHQAGGGHGGRLRQPGPAERSDPVHAVELPDDLPLRQRRRLHADQRRRHLRRQLRPQGRHADRLLPGTWGLDQRQLVRSQW